MNTYKRVLRSGTRAWTTSIEYKGSCATRIRNAAVLRLCSVKSPTEAQNENWVFSIARKKCRKRNVLCFQFTVVFPSWTSPVRIRSPAPCFQPLSFAHQILLYLVYLENPGEVNPYCSGSPPRPSRQPPIT